MKNIIFLSCFMLTVNLVSGQKGHIQTVPSQNQDRIETNPKKKTAHARMEEIDNIFNQMKTKLNELNVLIDKLKDNKDAVSDMSQQDMLTLQQLMEKKNQLETMISNTMKAANDAANAAIKNLKAS